MFLHKLVLCFYFIQSFVCGQVSNKYDFMEENNVDKVTTLETTTNAVPNNQCPPDKSLHSRNDIKVMINYLYTQLSIDKQLSEAYRSQAELVRDKYTQDLKQFIEWFKHQPEHLKHVLDGLGQVRTQYIEPIVKKISNVLQNYPNLEDVFNNKNTTMRKLLMRQRRYETMCSFNCEEPEEHKIFKREIRSDYHCSSLEDLHDKITQRLHTILEQLKSKTVNQMSVDNENYKEVIDKIKNNLKDKALREFGRTMYDILMLQDEYHHFVEDLNVTNIETDILSIQELNVQIDDKSLRMQKAVEKYGQYCRNCGNVLLVRSVRKTNGHFDKPIKEDSEDIIDSLIDVKYNETAITVKNDWNKIFNDLNELIRKVEEEDTNLDPLKPIQEAVVKMTKEERQALAKLKNIAPQATIKNVLDLVKISQDLLKNIEEAIVHIESLVKIHNN